MWDFEGLIVGYEISIINQKRLSMPFIMGRDETDSQQTAECLLVFLRPSILLEEEISAL
jgi:hypothetical protein